jgi:hypothetical protein
MTNLRVNLSAAKILLTAVDELGNSGPGSSLDGKTKESAKNILNKVIASPPGFFTDKTWEPVKAIMARLNAAKVNFTSLGDAYQQNAQGQDISKTWKLEFPFTNQKGLPDKLYGTIVASGAGSVEDPLSRYDITAYAN